MKPSELDLERWRRIDRILGNALDTPPAERAEYVAAECGGDEELRTEVEALLDAHRRAGRLFEASSSPLASVMASRPKNSEERRIGPFRLRGEIGRGGMGVVYLAEDERLGRNVAIKVLPHYLGAGAGAKERFLSEARAASALDHPNIATLYEIGEAEDGQLYMAFAYYEGETLAQRVAPGPLSPREAVEIAAHVSAGLQAAHAKGIVHRDVKPSNVLLTDGGEVKLLDFGVAKVVGEDVTGEGVRLGTVAYMSPEQTRGERVDPGSDLWSLGVVLYEMLTGKRPFQGHDHAALARSILEEEPDLSSVSSSESTKALRPVIEKLLCKSPDDRYESALDLLTDLRALKAGEDPPVAARLPPRRRAAAAARGSPIMSRASRRFRASVLILLVMTTGVWAASDFTSTPTHEIDRIAVLPLENLSGDPEQQLFVNGFHDALIADLGRTGVFDILSRASVMPYRGSERPISEIASELGVDAVVTGSVLQAGDDLEIETHFVAFSPEQELWSGHYRRSTEDVLMISGEMARSIVLEIDHRSSPDELRSTPPRRVDPRAYDTYLRGWAHWARRNRVGLDLARNYFERAIEIDSTFAPAYAGLAETYSAAAEWGLGRPSVNYERARALAVEALQIDRDLPEAYTALAAVESAYDWNWSEAERHARRAVRLNPSNVRALRLLGHAMRSSGRGDARTIFDRANALDTEIPGMGMAFTAYARRDFDKAIQYARSGQSFDEGLWQAPWLVCLSLSEKGLHDQAVAECERTSTRFDKNPPVRAGLGYAYARGGRRQEALDVIEELEDLGVDVYVGPSLIAIVYGALGERDLAFEYLDRAFENHDTLLMKLHLPFFDPLRSDPRFEALMANIGLEPPEG